MLGARVHEVLDRLPGHRRVGNGWIARCPVEGHGQGMGDRHPSLSIQEAPDGATLIHCHAGCPTRNVVAAVGLESSDLFPRKAESHHSDTIVATYDYRGESGVLLFQVCRKFPKGFFQRRPDGSGGWINNVGNTRRVPFHLPELLKADPREPVFIVEGEKDVLALEKLGLLATCNPGGAGRWPREFSEHLRDRRVGILPDNDVPGQNHAEGVAECNQGVAASNRILTLPGLSPGGDVSDWIQAGGTRDDLLRLLNESPEWDPHPPNLPEIVVNNLPMRDVTGLAVAALKEANQPSRFFRRGNELCRVRLGGDQLMKIEPLSEAALRGEMDRSANYRKTLRSGDIVPIPPPAHIVRDLLALPDLPFEQIDGVVSAPVLRPDGTVLTEPGYDPQTRLYYHPDPNLRIPEVSKAPTREEVEKARGLLKELICDFPFVDDASEANALAMLITPVVRPVISGPVPMAISDAPKQGTGKTLLGELVGLIMTGEAQVSGLPSNEEERRKFFTSLLSGGKAVCILDNLVGTIRSASLARLLTAHTWTDRILGQSKAIELPQRAVWIATANNVSLDSDLLRRCFWIRLDARMAKPWTRKEFTHARVDEWALEHRGELIWAILTLARAWHSAGCPQVEGPRLGKFESWCETLGGILAHAGIEGFLGNLDSMYEEVDDGEAEWEGFLRAILGRFGNGSFTVAELVEELNREGEVRKCLPGDLADGLEAGTDRRQRASFARRLGKALTQRREVRYGDDELRLIKAPRDVHRKANAWRVVLDCGSAEVAEVPPVDPEKKHGNSTHSQADRPPALPQLPHFRNEDDYDALEREAIQDEGAGEVRS